jgi:hypothetical protein
MVNMNMMGQMPGVQDTSEMAMQQAQAQAQLQAQFPTGTLQAAQGIYGTDAQKKMALMTGGTSASVI